MPNPALLAALAAHAAEDDRAARFPAASLALLHQEGLLALTTPARWGGGGAGLARAAKVVAAVGGACASTGLILAMQLIQQHLMADDPTWPLAVREMLGSSAVADGALVNTLRTEAALGAPTRGGLPETVARPCAEGWRLSGRKIYCTGLPGLRWLLVWARTEETAPRCGYFLVVAGSPGLRQVPAWDHLGLRASASQDLVLEDVPVPAAHAGELRPPAGWAALPDALLAWHALLPAAVYCGVAGAARNWVLGFLRARTPTALGAPLASLPRVQEAVGGIEELRLANARLLASACAAVDAGAAPPGREVNLLKVTLAENAVRLVEQCAALAGNHAMARRNPLERHWRDVLCARVHTPHADAARLMAGRAVLEQYPS